jgi:hypothetical protein
LTEQIEQAKSGALSALHHYFAVAPSLTKSFASAAGVDLSDLMNAEHTAAQATEAEALARAKTVRP